jgi:5'-nucleotidase
MYWIAGSGPAKDDSLGTDFHATALGHIAITPLKTDLTDAHAVQDWIQTVAGFSKS